MPISLLFWCGAQGIRRCIFPRLMGQISRLHYYERGLVFFINQQSWLASRKNGPRQHQWKQEIMKKVACPCHCPLVHGELHHKTICSNNQLKKELIEKMRQESKRPGGLPWLPRSAPTETKNHEKKAGPSLCPLVTVDSVTK